MEIKEYGIKNKKKFLFFPGSMSHYSWYLPAVNLLKEDWHVYILSYDGYDEPYDISFKSVEDTIKKLTEYFKERNILEFDIVYGLSMGGSMANLLYALDEFNINTVIMDGGITPYELPRILTRLILFRDVLMIRILRSSLSLIKKVFSEDRWLIPGEDSEEYYGEIKEYLNKISVETIRNSFDSCNNYDMPEKLPKNDTKFFYIYGEYERKDRDWDIKYIEKIYPNAVFKEIPDCEHGELCAVRPKQFLETIFSIQNMIIREE